jgi:hypothetical protein
VTLEDLEELGMKRFDRSKFEAGLDEGLLPLSPSNLLYMENPYSYKKCQ